MLGQEVEGERLHKGNTNKQPAFLSSWPMSYAPMTGLIRKLRSFVWSWQSKNIVKRQISTYLLHDHYENCKLVQVHFAQETLTICLTNNSVTTHTRQQVYSFPFSFHRSIITSGPHIKVLFIMPDKYKSRQKPALLQVSNREFSF